MEPTPASPSRRTSRSHERFPCASCGQEFERRALSLASGLRPSLFDHLAVRHAGWSQESWICRACLSRERVDFLMSRLEAERGELSGIETEFARKASLHLTLAEDIEKEFQARATRGQRIADRVASVGGSWAFVIAFFAVLLAWVVINSLVLSRSAFDPYPYILLNLVLSCLAAIQAPIIMMSQNRMSARDRMQADNDFRINLKAELEVASLHEKVDHLLHSQWQHMVELQELQLELLTELTARRAKA
jgi:uncharacterized membrane protein